MFLISFFVGIYYNVVVAWSFHYLFASMQSALPWTSCGNSWNTISETSSRYAFPIGMSGLSLGFHRVP